MLLSSSPVCPPPLLRVDNSRGKRQGRVGELALRDSFDVMRGCANSGPGRLGILKVMQMDGLGFSLCAAPLEIVGSCISECDGQNRSRENGGPEYSRLERGRGTLVSEGIVLR